MLRPYYEMLKRAVTGEQREAFDIRGVHMHATFQEAVSAGTKAPVN